MDYFIAIDSGGTKTDAVLFDTEGHILHRDLSGGCNPMDIGREAAENKAFDVISGLCAKAPKPVKSVFGGIAGKGYFGNHLYEFLRPRLDVEKLRIEDDGGNLVSGAFGRVDGCSLICGTGSSLLIRVGGDIVWHIGGRGYLIDTGGSGYELGRMAIRAAFRAVDGRGENTVLVELVEKEMGTKLERGMKRVYTEGRSYIASFAHLIFEGRDLGDKVCYQIIDYGTTCLAELTWAAEKYFGGAEFRIAMGGGIFAAYPDYARTVIDKSSKKAHMVCRDVPPVYGAAVEAMGEAGFDCGADFEATFLADYKKWNALKSRP